MCLRTASGDAEHLEEKGAVWVLSKPFQDFIFVKLVTYQACPFLFFTAGLALRLELKDGGGPKKRSWQKTIQQWAFFHVQKLYRQAHSSYEENSNASIVWMDHDDNKHFDTVQCHDWFAEVMLSQVSESHRATIASLISKLFICLLIHSLIHWFILSRSLPFENNLFNASVMKKINILSIALFCSLLINRL